jgi:hypothetical protein
MGLKKIEKIKCLGVQTPQRMRWFPCVQDCFLTLTCHLAYTSCALRSFGFFRVWPGLVSPGWPLDPLLVSLLFLPAQPSVCEDFRSLRFSV